MGITQASPPGESTFGSTPHRVNGKIVYEPYESNMRPYYYQGNLIFPRKGAPYRDSSGQIQYDTQYSAYPFKNSSINYQYERQRMRDVDRSLDQRQQQEYGNYPDTQWDRNSPYYQPGPGYNQGYPETRGYQNYQQPGNPGNQDYYYQQPGNPGTRGNAGPGYRGNP